MYFFQYSVFPQIDLVSMVYSKVREEVFLRCPALDLISWIRAHAAAMF
jgi:hypothetical protein